MKRLWILVALCLVVPFILIASERVEDMVLTVLMSPEPRNPVHEMIGQFAEDYDVEVEIIDADITTGSTITIDTMIAAGEPPDVYMDYLARTGKFITPEYALPLNDYINLDVYNMVMEQQFVRDGNLYALLRPAGIMGLFVNLDVMETVGLRIPDSYSIDDYLAAAEVLKQHGKYMTCLFAANQSGDYFYMQYFASFGADLFNDDYTESLADSPEGLATMRFLDMLIEKGYAPKESAVYSDDDYLVELFKGNCAVGGLFIGHLAIADSMIEQGVIDKLPRYKFVSFPNDAPAVAMPHAVVGHRSEDKKRNELTAALIEYITSRKVEEWMVTQNGVFPTRKDVTVEYPGQDWADIKAFSSRNGIYDLGLAHPKFGEIRQQMFPLLQQMYQGKLDPQGAIRMYDERVTDILK